MSLTNSLSINNCGFDTDSTSVDSLLLGTFSISVSSHTNIFVESMASVHTNVFLGVLLVNVSFLHADSLGGFSPGGSVVFLNDPLVVLVQVGVQPSSFL